LAQNWTLKGVRDAVKLILDEDSTLFDDMTKKIEENRELSDLMFDLSVARIKYVYNVDDPITKFGLMFGFLKKEDDGLQIHNKIFEIRLANYFVMKNARNWRKNNMTQTWSSEIIKNNIFDMELCLNRFKEHYAGIFIGKDVNFLEREGKLIFLTYLIPLINGTGFYHFESETRDSGKMDLVITYLKQQFILELKLWRGDSKHEDAYQQLANYLQSKNIDRGYLLTFDFRRRGDDRFSDNQWVTYDGKQLFDVVVRVGNDKE
jgi:hypothetical protein